MQRKAGWEERFAAYLAEAQRTPFAWGRHDCLLFASSDIQALLGYDPAAQWRGEYADEIEALRFLRRYLGSDADLSRAIGLAAERIASEIGAKEQHRAFVKRGDVALVRGEMHETLAVVDDSARRLAAVTPKGLIRLPLTAGLKFWAVG